MRTVLYANEELSDYLRENFVLAWTSERPVPKVTIDFGDGRVLHRTLTGNAAHYVLDERGRPIDVIPGLYGPQPFRKVLSQAHSWHQELRGVAGDERSRWLLIMHLEGLLDPHQIDLRQFLGPVDQAEGWDPVELLQSNTENEVIKFIRALINPESNGQLGRTERDDRDYWLGLASRQRDLVRLDRRSVVLMARSLPEDQRLELTSKGITETIEESRPFPDARRATQTTESKMAMAEEVVLANLSEPDGTSKGMITRFLETLIADSIRNEREFHMQIHGWFALDEVDDFTSLNDRVYSELFLTPKDDPWLGLVPDDSFTALDDDGRE